MALAEKRVVVGISGASGSVLGIECLKQLRSVGTETHLVISHAAHKTIQHETTYDIHEIEILAHTTYNPEDIGATIASGSFSTTAMIIAPCSIRTLSEIANCHASSLMTRAADVTLKEGRPLLLMVRETPFHPGHIRLMELAATSGAIIFPPIPSFYSGAATIDEMVKHIVGRALFRLGIHSDSFEPWSGL